MIYNLINYIRDITKLTPRDFESHICTPEVTNLTTFDSTESLEITLTTSFKKHNVASRKPWCALYSLPESSCLFPPIIINSHKKKLGRHDFNSDDINVSTFHFVISFQSGSNEAILIDRSKNGTYVNGLRVAYDRPIKIYSGYSISLSQPNGKLGVPHFIFYRLKPQARPSKVYQLENKTPILQSGTRLDVLSSELECFLCKQIFTNCLVVYPCFHSFCGACLLFERFPSHCSLCNSLIQDIRPNHIMNKIAEGYLDANPRLKLHPALEKTHILAKDHIKNILDLISTSDLDLANPSPEFGYEVDSFHFNDTFDELLSLHLQIQDDVDSMEMDSKIEIGQGPYTFLKKRTLINDHVSTAIAVLKDSAHNMLFNKQYHDDSNFLVPKRYESIDYDKKRRLLIMSPDIYNQTVMCSQCNISFHLPAKREMVECAFCHRFFCCAVKRCSAITETDKSKHFFGTLSSLTPSREPVSWAWGNDLESEIVQVTLSELGLTLSELYEKILVLLALRHLKWESSYLASQGATLHSSSCQNCICDLVFPELVFLAKSFIKPQTTIPRPLYVKDCAQGRLCQEQKISEHHRIHYNHYCSPNPYA